MFGRVLPVARGCLLLSLLLQHNNSGHATVGLGVQGWGRHMVANTEAHICLEVMGLSSAVSEGSHTGFVAIGALVGLPTSSSRLVREELH